MTADLVAFLNARLDEDERIAKAAVGDHYSVSFGHSDWTVIEHIDRWTSARVLADVQAKRAILDDIVDEVDGLARRVDSEWGIGDYDPTGDAADRLVRLLALPYRDHADYRPEWAPDV